MLRVILAVSLGIGERVEDEDEGRGVLDGPTKADFSALGLQQAFWSGL